MKKTLVSTAVASVLASSAFALPAQAEMTGNIGVSNNYLWRGVTQTEDQASVSGGLDYSHASGLYAGTWASNVNFGDETSDDNGYELDLYAGYAGEAGAVGYDLGVIHYAYPVHEDADFTEAYVSGSVSYFSAGLAYTFNSDLNDDECSVFCEGDIYYHAGVDVPIKEDVGLGFTVGSYEFDNDSDADYTHYAVNVSKGDFAVGLEQNDTDDDDVRFLVSWSKAFSF